MSLKLGTTFVLLWTNGRFIGGNNAIQTYLSNEFHLPGANTWNAKTHVKRAKSVYDINDLRVWMSNFFKGPSIRYN